MKSFRVSVVICTHNRHDLLAGAIESVLRQDYDDLDVIVVDNSPDQAAARDFGRRYEDRISYLYEPLPGVSRARNIGVRHSRHPIVAFMDDDAVATPGWVRNLVEAFVLGDDVGVVGGRVIPIWPAEKPAWVNKQMRDFLSELDWGDKIRPLREKEWIVGCNSAFRKDMLLQAGGFSEKLGRRDGGMTLLSNEETEIVDRMRRLNAKVIYTPFAEVYHRISPERLNPEWFYRRAAWQAVSDFMSDSAEAAKEAGILAERFRPSFAQVPHEDVAARMRAVRDIVTVCLAGLSMFPGEERPLPREGIWDKVVSLPGKVWRRTGSSS